jgi:hypothetical protein
VVRKEGLSLSRYWAGPQPVLTIKGYVDQSYFNAKVTERNGNGRVVTHVSNDLVASHLILNRLPDKAIMMILERHSR